MPETLNKAPIAIVDEDQSPLSQRIISAFQAKAAQNAAQLDRKTGRWTPTW
jgi:ABC-2 type transport system permease protein